MTISTERAGETGVLRVRDTGQGIRTDLLARVFDLFVQEPQSLDRSRGGLGLGLALVKRLVELHGGSVAVWSAGPGQGSEFTVRLPAVAAPVAAGGRRERPGSRPGPARSRRVLVVEDSPDARQSLRMLLEMAGHEVQTSEDGPSGLAKLHAFQPGRRADRPGPARPGRLRAGPRGARRPETRAIRLVAVTGYGQAEDRRRALAAGFDLHVTKPVDMSMLEEMLGRARPDPARGYVEAARCSPIGVSAPGAIVILRGARVGRGRLERHRPSAGAGASRPA